MKALLNPFESSPLSMGQAILAGTVVDGLLDATDGVAANGILTVPRKQAIGFGLILNGIVGHALFAGLPIVQ